MIQLLLRADANARIGAGHVMRCLALAQAWQEAGGQATFLMTAEAPNVEARLATEKCLVQHLAAQPGSAADAQQTIEAARRAGAEWVVVDGYQFGSDYQQALKQAGLRLLFIDDYGHAGRYAADLVLNQNLSAEEGLYSNRETHTRLLLGAPYVLLRREFWPWRGWQRQIPPRARKVLVTLGGGDPDNVTLKVIQALQHLEVDKSEAVVVVGASNPHQETIEAACQATQVNIDLRYNVTDMPALMAWADMAVSGGGSTCWELAFMGLPTLAVVLAENQRLVAERLQTAGAVTNLGEQAALTPDRIALALANLSEQAAARLAMSQRGQALVDGHGASRVLMRLRGDRFWLRAVCAADCRLIWEWANDPAARRVSFSTEPIPWESHVTWFERKRHDPNCLYYLAVDGQDQAIGQIRYECQGREAIVSVEVAPAFRGQGYGSQLIRQASQQALRQTQLESILAYVKPGNEASARAFQAAGFRRAGQGVVKGQPALLFSLSREADL